MAIRVRRTLRTGGRSYAFVRERVQVVGRVRPFIAGETVEIRFSRRGRLVRSVVVPVEPTVSPKVGVFSARVLVGRRGRLAVRAVHRPTAALRAFTSRTQALSVVPAALAERQRGPLIGRLQSGLAGLGYSVRITGRFDRATARAVLTWRRIARRPAGYAATPSVVREVLAGRGAFRARFPGHGRHVEADLSRGVLALLEGSRVVRLVQTSPGARKTPTITGSFTFGRKEPGVNNLEMVHSNYFRGGFAVHGYAYVPDFPSSHGCLRVPLADAAAVDRFIRIGDRIDVYQ